MALVVLSVVEQRLDAVRAVLAGASVVEVARACGVSRQSVHTWLSRYLVEGVPGLADRSHRPMSCPHQASPAVEAEVAEMRRAHPRWGAKRIRMELLRRYPGGTTAAGEVVPSERTINRVLARHGLLQQRPRKKPRSAFRRFEREAPMQLWQIDIVEGVQLVDPVQVRRIRGARPAGPSPRPSTEPVRVQRRASNSGVVMVAGQKVALGRDHAHQSLTIAVSETTLAIELDDGDTRVVRRTTDQAVRSVKEQRRPTAPRPVADSAT